MPGIVGVVSPWKENELSNCLDNMISRMRHRDWYKTKQKITEDVGIANISLDDENTFSVEGSTFLTVTGEIYDQGSLRARLSDTGVKNISQYSLSKVLLTLYLKRGVSALCGLNGIYVIAIWEESPKKLTIIDDRYGFMKLYYWLANGQLMFASEYKSIIWYPGFNKKISELALADFLSLGHLLDDRTFFEDIKLIPPASVMTFHEGRLSIHAYWDYQFYASGDVRRSEDYYVDQFALMLGEAVRKMVKDNTCILLTGGKDSRTLAAMLSEYSKDINISTNTIGHKHCYDVRFGKQIARGLRYQHTFLPVGPNYMAQYSSEGVWRLEGAAPCNTFWVFAEDAFLEGNRVKYTMTGDFGDVLAGYFLPKDLLGETDEEKAVRFFYGHSLHELTRGDELAKLLKPTVYRNVEGETFNSVRRCFRSANADNILNKCEYVALKQRLRRYNSLALEILGAFSRVLFPFAENGVADFLLRVPPDMRIGQRIYKKMIVKHLPRVAKIPQTKSGLPFNATILRYGIYRPWNIFYVWNYFYSYILPRITFHRLGHNLVEFVHHDEWMRTGSRDFVVNVLNQKEYLEDYFDMDMVDNLVADHMEGRRNEAGKISALLTFSLFRKQFCQQG
jgi:asparagine synthase (glutamine-hydrolysing)